VFDAETVSQRRHLHRHRFELVQVRLPSRTFGTDVQRKCVLIVVDYCFYFCILTLNFFAEVVLDITANFSGNSYLQLENSLLDRNKREHSISMTFTTDSANGLLYWQGQEPNNDGVVDNYIAISSERITVNYINNKSLQIQFNI